MRRGAPDAGGTAPVRIAVLAYEGVDELDLFGAYVPLAKARAALPRPADLALWIGAADPEVAGSNGVRIHAQAGLDTVRSVTALVIPGGRGVAEACQDARYLAAVRDAHQAGAVLYAVCSGSFLIAAAGLASGRTLAVHARKRRELAALGSCAVADTLVRDGALCSVGGSRERRVKGVDLAFQVLRDWLPGAVEPVAARLETEPGEPAL